MRILRIIQIGNNCRATTDRIFLAAVLTFCALRLLWGWSVEWRRVEDRSVFYRWDTMKQNVSIGE